jgi:transcription initiation factor TFIIIB Brf1 subunit/transcription initiation factor TFIIB
MCDHVKTKIVEGYKKECLACGQQFCTHPQMDFESTCMMCGEYITEMVVEQTWVDVGFNNINTIVKNTKDHMKQLSAYGYPSDIIESAMDKFAKVGCSLSEEPAVMAFCVWMAFLDAKIPRTMFEIAKKHGLTKSKIKKGRQIVLSLDYFKEYKTAYITITMMTGKIIEDLKIDKKYHAHIFEIAKFVEDNWDKSKHTRRCAPQNVASACVFLYLNYSPSLKEMVNTPTKKKAVCAVMGPSLITIDKIMKQLCELFIKVPKT